LSSRWFFVPGVIGSLTLVLVITLTAFAVVREREIGTLEQIMVTPIRPAEFIMMEFHISRDARERYQFAESLFSYTRGTSFSPIWRLPRVRAPHEPGARG
jgi:hypothetical protein